MLPRFVFHQHQAGKGGGLAKHQDPGHSQLVSLQTLELNFIWVGLGKLKGKGVTQFSVLYGGGFSWRIV